MKRARTRLHALVLLAGGVAACSSTDDSAAGATSDGGASSSAVAPSARVLRGGGASSPAVSPSPCTSYASCASPFVECSYDGLSHALPSGWGDDTWAFFTAAR